MGYNLSHLRFKYTHPPGGGGGGGEGLPYISHIGTCHPKGWGLLSISVLTGLHFAYFGLESGMVFEGTMGCEYIYYCSSKWLIYKFEMDFKNLFFVCCSTCNLSNDDSVYDTFWSEIKSEFGETGGTHPPRIPRRKKPLPLGHTHSILESNYSN